MLVKRDIRPIEEPMGKSVSTIRIWTYCLLLASLAPVARLMAVDWQWSATVVMIGGVACLAAVSPRFRLATFLAAVASIWCIAEPFAQGVEPSAHSMAFSIIAACGLLALTRHLSTTVRRISERLLRFESNHSEQIQAIQESLTQSTTCTTSADSEAFVGTGTVVVEPDEDEPVDYANLFRSLQEIGRRISSHLDFERLHDTIVDISKTVLKCAECDVLVWNQRDQDLRPLPFNRRSLRYANTPPDPEYGMLGWVVRHRQLLTLNAIHQDANFPDDYTDPSEPPDAVAPLIAGQEFLGVLVIRGYDCASMRSLHLLHVFATFSALGLKNAQLFRRIENMARRDGLTGLLNHATFYLQLRELMVETTLKQRPLTLIMCDIDRFKQFNDTYGHQAGDEVLREVARVWNAVLPDSSIVARYGGEEFVCALIDYDEVASIEIADLLRTTLANHPVEIHGRSLHVTASFGVATLTEDAHTTEELIHQADAALYRAKASGRNRVIVWKPTQIEPIPTSMDDSIPAPNPIERIQARVSDTPTIHGDARPTLTESTYAD